jgi:hypothetical protein
MTNNKVDHIRISDVRSVARMLITDQQVTDFAVGVAQGSLSIMREEAMEHGLTEAEVIKAVLAPLFEKKPKGCDCYTCKARRSESEGERSEELQAAE